MITPKNNRRLLAGIVLLALVSCSPLAAYEPTSTATATAQAFQLRTPTPVPYWQLAARQVKRLTINPANYSGRIGY